MNTQRKTLEYISLEEKKPRLFPIDCSNVMYIKMFHCIAFQNHNKYGALGYDALASASYAGVASWHGSDITVWHRFWHL